MKVRPAITVVFAVLTGLVVLLASCTAGNPQTPGTAAPPITSTPGAGLLPQVGQLIAPAIPGLATAVATRTPEPTATPDAVTNAINQFVAKQEIPAQTLLWIKLSDWINLGVSILYVLLGYLVGTWLIRWLLPRLVRRTATTLDDQLLQNSGDELRWIAVVTIFRVAADRLAFVSADVKTWVGDVCFFITLYLGVRVLWRLINMFAEETRARSLRSGSGTESESLITLLIWALRFVLLVVVLTFLLGHYGVNVTGYALFLSVILLVISLAGRDLLADIIAGGIILADRPYRVGDRVDLPSLSTWGDVVEIGLRSTRVLAIDNRMVVLPNSRVAGAQVVNYSYPDPAYWDNVDVLVAYDNDTGRVRELVGEAILSTEGVVKDRGPFIQLMRFDESHMVFTAGWWIASYRDRYTVHGRVCAAIIEKLKSSGVVLPYRRSAILASPGETGDALPGMDDPE